MSQLEKPFTDSVRKEHYRNTIALGRFKAVEGEYVSVHFLELQDYLEKLEMVISLMPKDFILRLFYLVRTKGSSCVCVRTP